MGIIQLLILLLWIILPGIIAGRVAGKAIKNARFGLTVYSVLGVILTLFVESGIRRIIGARESTPIVVLPISFIVVVIILLSFAIITKKKVSDPKPSLSLQPTPEPQGRPSEINIFISYRRQDSADITGRIYDRLTQHFGRRIVFRDVDSIPIGADFRKHLNKQL